MRGPALLALLAACLLSAADSTEWIRALGGTVQSDSAGRVVAVNLRGTWVNDVEMIDLARMPDLERVDLSHTRISDEGMLHLKPAMRIRELNLYYAEQITDQGMAAIRNWKMLRRLNLRGTRIANGTLEIVSRMPQLEALDIANTQVTDNGMDPLIQMIGLKELSLGRSRVGEADLGFLRMLPTLTYLDLSGARPTPPDAPGGRGAAANIPEETLKAIAELSELRVLQLGYSAINADGLHILSALNKVEKLGLQGCSRVDDAALAELAGWKSLKYLDLQEDPVTEKGLEMLRSARPQMKILSGGKPPLPPLPYSR